MLCNSLNSTWWKTGSAAAWLLVLIFLWWGITSSLIIFQEKSLSKILSIAGNWDLQVITCYFSLHVPMKSKVFRFTLVKIERSFVVLDSSIHEEYNEKEELGGRPQWNLTIRILNNIFRFSRIGICKNTSTIRDCPSYAGLSAQWSSSWLNSFGHTNAPMTTNSLTNALKLCYIHPAESSIELLQMHRMSQFKWLNTSVNLIIRSTCDTCNAVCLLDLKKIWLHFVFFHPYPMENQSMYVSHLTMKLLG